jgi:arylsulfatase A-like enzyme
VERDPRPDIVFFLLDGVRPDRLASCGAAVARRPFLDGVLESGTLLTQAVCAGPYTSIAVNALFTGLYGSTNGVNGAYKTTTDDLDPEAVCLTEVLKEAGYSTLCFAGSPFEPMEPVHGFDVYRLLPHLDSSVLEAFEAAPPPRFLCLSFQQVHDACCNRPQEMTPEGYDRAVSELAADFERFYRRLRGPGALALVYSDHGMRLRERIDPAWEPRPELEPTTGVYLTEGTVRSFAALIGEPLFPRRRIDQVVRSVDLAPTLLEALGLPPLLGQGRSLWPEIRAGRPLPELAAYTETGGRWFSPWEPNVRGVRRGRFKLTRHDELGEALFDLAADPAEERNLVGRGLPEEAELRRELEAQLRSVARPPGWHYAARGFDHRRYLARRPPPPAVPELSKGMNAYEGVVRSLADAALGPMREHAAALAQLARREAGKVREERERGAQLLLAQAAEELTRAADLESARKIFARISQALIAFIAERPLFAHSLVAWECPEAPGGGRWVQKRNDDRVVNPYLGRGASAPVREVGFGT